MEGKPEDKVEDKRTMGKCKEEGKDGMMEEREISARGTRGDEGGGIGRE